MFGALGTIQHGQQGYMHIDSDFGDEFARNFICFFKVARSQQWYLIRVTYI